MAIVRVVVVDPQPDPNRASDLLVYQVPENSRELTILVDAFMAAGHEPVIVRDTLKKKKAA